MIIDTHIHLDHEKYQEDLQDVLQRARDVGVKRFVIPGADPKTLQRALAICEANDDVFFAVGIHPYDIESFAGFDFSRYASHPKCVAIGECGLDYFRLEGDEEQKQSEKNLQQDVFRAQIRLAKQYKKPLIVHIRDASRDSKAILLEEGASEVGGVLHCFNADEELLSLSDEGFYFGIGGVVTFKNAKKLVKILPKIPQEKLVIETDGPYLTPTPHRGERNEPCYTKFIAEKIAELLEKDLDQIEAISSENALKLFDIS